MHRMIQAGEGPRIVMKISRQFSGMGHEKNTLQAIVTYLVQKSRKRKGLLS